MSPRRDTRRRNDYRIAIISALSIEHACAEGMLDEIHKKLPKPRGDRNTYTYGRIGAHNVVLACLPQGVPGTAAAAAVAITVSITFKKLRFGLLVGVAGGVPKNGRKDKGEDIRLGDIVVGTPSGIYPGVVQYDMGKSIPARSNPSQDETDNNNSVSFTRTGSLNQPPEEILGAVAALRATHLRVASRVPRYIHEMCEKYPFMKSHCSYQGNDLDQLFEPAYNHEGSRDDCILCDRSRLLARPPRRNNDPVIHYGTIASANQVMRHGSTRDKFAKELGVLCFEMEAGGLMNSFPCLVIRGVCDYADSHKTKRWQPYAAAAAAAYAKELLNIIDVEDVEQISQPYDFDAPSDYNESVTQSDYENSSSSPRLVPMRRDFVESRPQPHDSTGNWFESSVGFMTRALPVAVAGGAAGAAARSESARLEPQNPTAEGHVLERYPAYLLAKDALEDFLKQLFGKCDFQIEVR